ncbi:Protein DETOXIFICATION 47, chloroplastic [Branchiostoma belcheri]|nr:Protein DETOXIFICATION 47, chloroplastic [Branchiostoma belcheri]
MRRYLPVSVAILPSVGPPADIKLRAAAAADPHVSPGEDLKGKLTCKICLQRGLKVSFQCGHMFCQICATAMATCPACRVVRNEPRESPDSDLFQDRYEEARQDADGNGYWTCKLPKSSAFVFDRHLWIRLRKTQEKTKFLLPSKFTKSDGQKLEHSDTARLAEMPVSTFVCVGWVHLLDSVYEELGGTEVIRTRLGQIQEIDPPRATHIADCAREHGIHLVETSVVKLHFIWSHTTGVDLWIYVKNVGPATAHGFSVAPREVTQVSLDT